MTDMIVDASARSMRRSLTTGAVTSLLSLIAVSVAFAQQPRPAAPPARPAPAPAPAQAPAAAAPAAPQQQTVEGPQLFFTPWLKVCGKGQEAGAKQTCITSITSHTEVGYPMIGAALIETEGEAKILRVSVPVPVILPPGQRIIVDQGQPISGQYLTCFNNGCFAQYEATPDVVGKIKGGQALTVQFVALGNQIYSMKLPLTEFKKANEGPASDPKQVEEQEKKLAAELQKRADDARKRLEAQQGAQAPK
jgi:invasion protein IalB